MLNMGIKKPKATSEATRGCRSFTPKSSNHFIGDLLRTRKHIGLQESRCCPSGSFGRSRLSSLPLDVSLDCVRNFD